MKKTKENWNKKLIENISTQIKDLRKEYNLTQKELSEKSGISVNVISRIELKSTNPTIDTLYKLFKGFDMDIWDYITSHRSITKAIDNKRKKKGKTIKNIKSTYKRLDEIQELKERKKFGSNDYTINHPE